MGVRLDLNNPETVAALIDFGVDVDAFIVNSNPVDVCIMCYDDMALEDDVEHPPYNEMVYNCCSCGVRLRDDNEVGCDKCGGTGEEWLWLEDVPELERLSADDFIDWYLLRQEERDERRSAVRARGGRILFADNHSVCADS